MELLNEQEKFIDLIKNEYPENPEITTEFLDLDKFKNDSTLFIDFANLEFKSDIDDDCGEYGRLAVQCYLVLRNDTPKNLNNKLLNNTGTFYKFLKENSIKIESIDFYNYASGTKYIVASEFSLILNILL